MPFKLQKLTNNNQSDGMAIPIVVVFIGTFFIMASFFYFANQTQKPLVEILDLSTSADYLALGMSEILKLKIKEFPEEFRDSMIKIEEMENDGKKPWPEMYMSYLGSPEYPYTHFFHDFIIKKNHFNVTASDKWAADGSANAWDAHWQHLTHYMFWDGNNDPKYKDNKAFKEYFKNYIERYSVIVNLRGIKRVHIDINAPSGASANEYLNDIIKMSFESQYKNQKNQKTTRLHEWTFNHKRKYQN